MKWIPGHESSLNFWLDYWLDIGPLRPILQGAILQESINLKIKDVISPYGWNWLVIPFDLPLNIKASIQAVPVPIAVRSCDKLAWKGSLKGDFSSKSAYLLATNPSEFESFSDSWIWKLHTLHKIQMFIEKCMHNSVGVRSCLAERGMPIPTNCPMCHTEPESISHALQDCRLIKPIWHQLGWQSLNQHFFSQDLRDWLTSNAKFNATHSMGKPPWNIIFPFVVWLNWKQRN